MEDGKNLYYWAGQGIYKYLIKDQDRHCRRVIHIYLKYCRNNNCDH